MYCQECGTQNKDQAKFCSKCGATMKKTEAPVSAQLTETQKPKKKKGCLIAIIGIILFSIGITWALEQASEIEENKTNETATSAKTEEEIEQEALDMDADIWNGFINSAKAHKDLLVSLDAFTDGKITKLDFYDQCKKIEKYQREISVYFSRVKGEEVKPYSDTCATFALSSQVAAEQLKKYLDKENIENLSKAKENIQKCSEAMGIVAQNRGVYLKNAGVSEEEILKLIENVEEEMQFLDQ